MIDSTQKKSLTTLLSKMLCQSLDYVTGKSAWELHTLSNTNEMNTTEFSMITLTSYTCRFILLLHFNTSKTVIECVANSLKMTSENLSNEKLYDFVGEITNMFCGSMKRTLGMKIPHLGMSVPNHLPKQSMIFFKDFDCEFQTHLEARTANELIFGASLFLWTYGKVELKFAIDEQEQITETGAFELL